MRGQSGGVEHGPLFLFSPNDLLSLILVINRPLISEVSLVGEEAKAEDAGT